MAKKTEQPKTELTMAQRFTNAVVKSYGDVARDIEVTPKQMNLISNYYIKIDNMFNVPDSKVTWQNVNMNELSLTLAHMAKLNLDMQLGHFSFMPFWSKKANKYNLSPVISKDGSWFIAKTYGIDPPDSYVIELVHKNDKFSITKKDANHEWDTYTFEVTAPFDRGEIIGGFGYLEYKDKSKNKIIAMSKEEILKYKRNTSSDAFWSGENLKKMYEKTIAKQLFKKVSLDPRKVNDVQDSFKRIEIEELNFTSAEAKDDIDSNMCSGDVIDIEFDDIDNNSENTTENTENLNLLGDIIEE